MLIQAVLFSLLYFMLPVSSLAQDDSELLKSRPSYQQIFTPCKANLDEFKLSMYHRVYTDSVISTIKLLSLIPSEISTNVATRGTSPYLDWFLQNETTIPALKDCFQNERAHHSFIVKLLVSGALGRIVGISITAVSLKYIGGAAAKTLKYLKSIAGSSGKYISLTVTAAGAAFAIKQLYNDNKNESDNSDYQKTMTQINNIGNQLSKSAKEQIINIQEQLKNPSLSDLEKHHLEKELKDWQIVLTSFSS